MPPPRITEQPMDVMQPVTETAMFICVGQGYGFVDVNWVRINRQNRNEIALRQKSVVNTVVSPDNITSVLTIPRLENKDGRDYRCIYSNSQGDTRSNNATLTIGSKCGLREMQKVE